MYFGALQMGENAEAQDAAAERLQYGDEAVWAFKYKGVLPTSLRQQVSGVLTLHDYTFARYLEAAEGNRRVAQVLWEENLRRIKVALPEYEITGFALDPEGEEVRAFMHYTRQNLAKSKYTLPRWDDWNQVFYESNGGQSDLLPGIDIPRALTSLTTNYDEVKALFLQHKEHILEILETGNLVIISNHCTWLNLPLIAAFLHETLEIPLDRINTILGGALTTQHAGFEVANMNNLYKTVPDTPNGRLDTVAPELQKSVHQKFGMAFMRQLKQTGHVFLISPGGTTDKVTPKTIELLEASEGTKHLLANLGKKHHIWPIATHSGALYTQQKIKPGALRLTESGIIEPGGTVKALEVLRQSIETLNVDRKVLVHPEEAFAR